MKPSILLGLLAMSLAPFASSAMSATSASDCSAVVTRLPAASATFTVGTLRVQRYGEHGRPVILIPGLGSGSWVWAGTINHLRGKHVVYALTLAGFDGVPAPAQKTGLLDLADASLLKLIKRHHINHPVLVGHSIGGTLAIRFAGEHSKLLAGVMAVDGLPVFPLTQGWTLAQRKVRAKAMATRMAAMTTAQFHAQQLRYMQIEGVIGKARAVCYAALQDKSNLAAVATYMHDDLVRDDRSLVKAIDVPLTEISPYYAVDFKAFAARTGKPVLSAAQKAAYYTAMLANDPHAKVVTIQDARHFVMLDQPQRFYQALDDFMTRLPAVK